MGDMDFLITLPSNSNMQTHPGNEQANYTVKLSEPLNLEGDWEVALVSVQYTPNWLTIKKAIQLIAIHVAHTRVPKNRLEIYMPKSNRPARLAAQVDLTTTAAKTSSTHGCKEFCGFHR